MFKIGEFSKIAQVSIRLLRYYDQIGLFKPDRIDPESGYRYYSIEQLPCLNRILALKDLGLSLDQVSQLLNDNISPQEIRGMLILKKKQLEQTIEEEVAQLLMVESRLSELESEGGLSEYSPVLKTVPLQNYLSIREHTARMAGIVPLMLDCISAARDKVGGDYLSAAVFYGDSFDSIKIDWEYGFLVEDTSYSEIALNDGRKLTLHHLPAVEAMISVVHHGSWRDLHRPYSALGRWMRANNYQFDGYGREIFWKIMPREQMGDNVTEVQFPIAPIDK